MKSILSIFLGILLSSNAAVAAEVSNCDEAIYNAKNLLDESGVTTEVALFLKQKTRLFRPGFLLKCPNSEREAGTF